MTIFGGKSVEFEHIDPDFQKWAKNKNSFDFDKLVKLLPNFDFFLIVNQISDGNFYFFNQIIRWKNEK